MGEGNRKQLLTDICRWLRDNQCNRSKLAYFHLYGEVHNKYDNEKLSLTTLHTFISLISHYEDKRTEKDELLYQKRLATISEPVLKQINPILQALSKGSLRDLESKSMPNTDTINRINNQSDTEKPQRISDLCGVYELYRADINGGILCYPVQITKSKAEIKEKIKQSDKSTKQYTYSGTWKYEYDVLTLNIRRRGNDPGFYQDSVFPISQQIDASVGLKFTEGSSKRVDVENRFITSRDILVPCYGSSFADMTFKRIAAHSPDYQMLISTDKGRKIVKRLSGISSNVFQTHPSANHLSEKGNMDRLLFEAAVGAYTINPNDPKVIVYYNEALEHGFDNLDLFRKATDKLPGLKKILDISGITRNLHE